jgi:hypothetical protein
MSRWFWAAIVEDVSLISVAADRLRQYLKGGDRSAESHLAGEAIALVVASQKKGPS